MKNCITNNLIYLEEEAKKPNILEYGIISNAGKQVLQSSSPTLYSRK